MMWEAPVEETVVLSQWRAEALMLEAPEEESSAFCAVPLRVMREEPEVAAPRRPVRRAPKVQVDEPDVLTEVDDDVSVPKATRDAPEMPTLTTRALTVPLKVARVAPSRRSVSDLPARL